VRLPWSRASGGRCAGIGRCGGDARGRESGGGVAGLSWWGGDVRGRQSQFAPLRFWRLSPSPVAATPVGMYGVGAVDTAASRWEEAGRWGGEGRRGRGQGEGGGATEMRAGGGGRRMRAGKEG